MLGNKNKNMFQTKNYKKIYVGMHIFSEDKLFKLRLKKAEKQTLSNLFYFSAENIHLVLHD